MKRSQWIAFGAATLAVVALFAWGAVAGAEEAMGIVVKKGGAELEVMEQLNPNGKVTIERVVAPEDAWVFLHNSEDGEKPGEMVGAMRVEKGVTENVEVMLESDKLTPTLIAALHADRGKANVVEFDMDNFDHSPDKPFFVDGMEMAMPFRVGKFGVDAAEGEAAIEVADQPGVTTTLNVDRAVSPTGAWLVVHLDDGGKPGDRVGLQAIPAGESRDVKVTLDAGMELTEKLLIAVHADRGTAGEFDFDMMKKLDSPDQPFFVGDAEVATATRVR